MNFKVQKMCQTSLLAVFLLLPGHRPMAAFCLQNGLKNPNLTLS